MTPHAEGPPVTADEELELGEQKLTRRQLVKTAAGLGAAAVASPFLAASARASTFRRAAKGKVIIGAFVDGALRPFKEKVIPLFERTQGIKVQFLEDDYGSFFEKAFNDGLSKAGQFDIYIMDDPWIPQYASAPVIQNLTKLGLRPDPDFMKPFLDLGWWPPKTGPRIKQFEDATSQLYAVPFIGDMQTLTYRTDIFPRSPRTWNELVTIARKKMSPAKGEFGYVFRGVKGNPIVASWFPVFMSLGGQIFDNNWKVLWNNPAGKKATQFFVKTLKSIAPPGIVEYDSDQEGAAILGGKAFAVVQYSGNAIKSDDPKQSKEVGKLGFGVVPRGPKSIAQIGIFISGISVSAPNPENALTFQKWFARSDTQIALARAGALPVKRSAFKDARARRRNRLGGAVLAQLDTGALARPRTPDWAKIEDILGTHLNLALVAGDVSDHLDEAAKESTAFLKKQGYYS